MCHYFRPPYRAAYLVQWRRDGGRRLAAGCEECWPRNRHKSTSRSWWCTSARRTERIRRRLDTDSGRSQAASRRWTHPGGLSPSLAVSPWNCRQHCTYITPRLHGHSWLDKRSSGTYQGHFKNTPTIYQADSSVYRDCNGIACQPLIKHLWVAVDRPKCLNYYQTCLILQAFIELLRQALNRPAQWVFDECWMCA